MNYRSIYLSHKYPFSGFGEEFDNKFRYNTWIFCNYMKIFNVFRYITLGGLILFVNLTMYGVTNYQFKIDTVRISFTQVDGYASYRSVVSYAYRHNAYQLQTIYSPFPYRIKNLPGIINKKYVTRLLNDCSQYSSEDQCDYIYITEDDYSNYLKILNNNDSLISNFPQLEFCPDFRKERYELTEDDFLSLSCTDIINIIESPHQLFFANNTWSIKLELLDTKGKKIVIEPQWYFKGTAWKVKFSQKEVYVGYEYILSFLRGIHFDQYAFFWEKYNLLFQIVESIIRKNKYLNAYE